MDTSQIIEMLELEKLEKKHQIWYMEKVNEVKLALHHIIYTK